MSAGDGANTQSTIAVTPEGFIHMAWSDAASGVSEIRYISGDGTNWSGIAFITDQGTGAADPAIAVDPSGDVHLVWEDRRVMPGASKIFYRKRADGIWQTEEQLTFEEYTDSREPAVATDLEGRVHVVWKDERTSFGDIYYRCWQDGAWGPEEAIVADTDNTSRTPAIACDAFGNVHVVWSDNMPGHYAIYYSVRNPLGWSLPVLLSAGIGPARYPAIAIDASGKVYVAWEDQRTGVYGIYFKERIALPGDVTDEPVLLTDAFRCEPNPFCGRALIRLSEGLSPAETRSGLPLAIFGADGRRVRLLEAALGNAGPEFTWDGNDQEGRPLPPGTYFCRLEGAALPAGKVILLR